MTLSRPTSHAPHRMVLFSLLAALFLAPACASSPKVAPPPLQTGAAQPEPPSVSPEMQLVLPLAEKFVRDQRSRGLVVALVTPERVEVRGLGELAASAAPEKEVFEIGSITKLFTGMALASLVEEGKVTPDTPLADCLPENARLTSGAPLTLRHLTTHTSGLPALPANFWQVVEATGTIANPYARFGADELLAGLAMTPREAPGRYAYSNLGVGLLAEALAHCAGEKGWRALIAHRVTDVLGLPGISNATPLTVQGHDANLQPVPNWTFDALGGAGALHANAADLARLLQRAMSDEDDAGTRMIRRTLEPLFQGEPRPIGMGWQLGLAEKRTRRLGQAPWHGGMTGGFSSFVGFDPSAKVGIVILSNTASDASSLASLMLARLVDEALPADIYERVFRALHPLTAAEAVRLVGRYQFAPGEVLTVEARGEAGTELWATFTGQPAARVFPRSAGVLDYRMVPAKLTFGLPEDGAPATAVTLTQNGAQLIAPRVP